VRGDERDIPTNSGGCLGFANPFLGLTMAEGRIIVRPTPKESASGATGANPAIPKRKPDFRLHPGVRLFCVLILNPLSQRG